MARQGYPLRKARTEADEATWPAAARLVPSATGHRQPPARETCAPQLSTRTLGQSAPAASTRETMIHVSLLYT